MAAAYIEAWNSHDIERVTGLYPADYEGIDTGSQEADHGLDDLRRTAQRYFQAFPDVQMQAEELVAQGDRVAISWTATGTHWGKLMGIPPRAGW